MCELHRTFCHALLILIVAGSAFAQTKTETSQVKSIPYLKLTEPRHVLPDAQPWEGDQYPHTLSVLELKRGGFRYWGWYGLNEGRGIGLARSNDLVNWTKYETNPLWTNARWPSVLAQADPKRKDTLYFAVTRDYDTPSSHIARSGARVRYEFPVSSVSMGATESSGDSSKIAWRSERSRRIGSPLFARAMMCVYRTALWLSDKYSVMRPASLTEVCLTSETTPTI